MGVALIFLSSPSFSWNDRPHEQITQAAILSLPLDFQHKLGPEEKELIHNYCHYPDLYDPAGDVKRAAALRVYCVKPDGKSIHNVTWQRQEDTESLELVVCGQIEHSRQRNTLASLLIFWKTVLVPDMHSFRSTIHWTLSRICSPHPRGRSTSFSM